ncbi:uncharacterized protein MONBRDRAFT_39306 [Monosiga brevicollis MX1]|uniref:Uncharacterized protein n=1 Tax=Monosiga brevicollis TaxID=81824 RepID=A9VDM3_MONBE|nr:uncharacterized protein MONBRDRAFT_39306 [Monosiga brevicollis MX1]EDQ84326.1 predicted protein [Monosiga brevicollis MX1]|eukprot:XP_001750822.1 hypothetical protein [Monosiga brevicollis MX1]
MARWLFVLATILFVLGEQTSAVTSPNVLVDDVQVNAGTDLDALITALNGYTVIHGSVHINLTGANPGLSWATKLEQALGAITDIRGHLLVVNSDSILSDLSFFQNLRVIRAEDYYYFRDDTTPDNTETAMALVLMNYQTMTSIHLPKLHHFNNPFACYPYRIDWSRLGALAAPGVYDSLYPMSTLETSRWVDMTGLAATSSAYVEYCQSHTPCHEICGPIGTATCWGPGATQCQRCTSPNLLLAYNGSCVAACPDGYYADDWICQPCVNDCETCEGPELGACLSCPVDFLLENGRCKSVCTGDAVYGNVTTRTCEDCHPQCTTCTSPLSTTCTRCAEDFYLQPAPNNTVCAAECPMGYYASALEGSCLPCAAGCLACTGPANCSLCDVSADMYRLVTDVAQVCRPVSQCDSGSFASQAPTASSNRVCAAYTICPTGESYVTFAGNASYDRVCEPCTTCDEGMVYRLGTCEGTTPGVCVLENACSATPCENGGVCSLTTSGEFQCDCSNTGFCGTICAEALQDDGTCASELRSRANEREASTATTIGASLGGVALAALLVALIIVLLPSKRISGAMKKRIQALNGGKWELERDDVTIGQQLGAGHFGTVSRGLLRKSDGTGNMDVAVKQLKREADVDSDAADEFFHEMKLMMDLGHHQHVVSLVGVCTTEKPILMVIDFANGGDLLNHLRDARPNERREATLREDDFRDYCAQVAAGMEFLAFKRVIHRDLAARNVLVHDDGNGVVLKVADFGLTVQLRNDEEFRVCEDDALPFKWLAPECFTDKTFSQASDVWAFGVLMWEVYAFGQSPFPGIQNNEVYARLGEGMRMPRPADCSKQAYDIMMRCWKFDAAERPSFSTLLNELSAFAGKNMRDYRHSVDITTLARAAVDLGDEAYDNTGLVSPLEVISEEMPEGENGAPSRSSSGYVSTLTQNALAAYAANQAREKVERSELEAERQFVRVK